MTEIQCNTCRQVVELPHTLCPAARCQICGHIRSSHWQGGGCGSWCCTGFVLLDDADKPKDYLVTLAEIAAPDALSVVFRIANQSTLGAGRSHLLLLRNGTLSAAAACGFTPKSGWAEKLKAIFCTCPDCIALVRLTIVGREPRKSRVRA